jgi:hypothetical protein
MPIEISSIRPARGREEAEHRSSKPGRTVHALLREREDIQQTPGVKQETLERKCRLHCRRNAVCRNLHMMVMQLAYRRIPGVDRPAAGRRRLNYDGIFIARLKVLMNDHHNY